MIFGFDDDQPAQPQGDFEAEGAVYSPDLTPAPDPQLRWLYTAVGLLAGLAIAFGTWALWPAGQDDQLTEEDVDIAVEEALATAAEDPDPATAVYNQAAPSLVVVRADGKPDSNGAGPSVNIGAGVVINERGQILTALHVVDGAASIELGFADGSTSPGEVVDTEPSLDLAVLKRVGGSGTLAPAVLGNSRTLQIGDQVFAVGNPLGLTGSVSAGVISGLRRDVPFPGAGTSTGADQDDVAVFEDLIQFDAAVNQGSSGGPLLNSSGEVIGIVTALADPSQQGFFIGIGFAVPIDVAASRAADGPSQ